MSSLVLAVVLSLVSAVAYAAGAIMQEHVAAASPARPYAPLHHAGWWLAVSLNGVGAVLHVIALAYGPLSVVQPLGALTIVFALPMAALFVGRRAGATAWRGALLATVGLAGLLAVAGDTGSHTLGTGQRGVLTAVTLGVVALLFLIAQTIHRPVLRSVLLAASAGVAFGIASVFTKTVAVDWEWSRPLEQGSSLAVIGGLALGGLLLSQASYRGAGLAAPLATVTVVNPVVAAVVGITMFGESFRYGVLGAVLALGFGVVAAAGLILLTTERLAAEEGARGGGAPGALPAPEASAEGTADGDPAARPAEPGTARGALPRAVPPPTHPVKAFPAPADQGSERVPQESGSGPRVRPEPASEARIGPEPASRFRPASDRDAARAEIGEGVDVGSVPRTRTDLEVEMRSRAVAGGT
ncbi:DMT family transporter [Streptomyces sp. NPDC014894]|uniref:DMT family transporter n=1 Tax=Streptomyces sp. NPDC014894 TaxID=3364931 RepID=UPI0036FCCA00